MSIKQWDKQTLRKANNNMMMRKLRISKKNSLNNEILIKITKIKLKLKTRFYLNFLTF